MNQTISRTWLTPLIAVPLLLAALWPVWRWYVARMSDGSDEPLGLLALVAAAVFLPRRGWRESLARPAITGACAMLVIYATAYDFIPPLVRAMLGVSALACVLPRERARSALPLFALLLLSLPLIATLQYFLGFPIRAVTAWCAAKALTVLGWSVSAHGTVLAWAGEEILVDAPCSGIRMLWTAAFVSAVLASLHRLPAWRPGGSCDSRRQRERSFSPAISRARSSCSSSKPASGRIRRGRTKPPGSPSSRRQSRAACGLRNAWRDHPS